MMKSIKSKISLILIVFLLLTVGNSLVSIRNFNKLQNSIDLIMYDNYESVVAAQNMIESLERQDSLELAFVFENSTVLSDEYKENNKKFQEWLYKAKGNVTEIGEEDTLIEIDSAYYVYSERVNALENVKETGESDAVRKYYYNDLLPLFNQLKILCSDLLNINQESMVNMKNESKELADTARNYTLTLLAVVLLLGVSIIGYLLKKIIKPIEDLAVGIDKVSNGKYDYSIPLSKDKEINYVLKDFNNMVSKLKEYERLNINEILREKQKAEAIIESIESPIIVTDDDNKITMVNKSAERLLDVKEKNIINRHFLESIELREIFNIIQEARKSIKEYKSEDDIELTTLDKTNCYRVTANPIWFENRVNIGTVTIMQDITKFKEIEKIKSEFISTVSHEFRTPLTSITMAVELILEENFDGKEGEIELLTIIREDSERLNQLVGELLDLSKMESGKIEMDMQEIDINDVIKQVNRAFKIQLEEKNINLNIDTQGVERKVRADVNKISWVMVNLVGNALRYTNEDGTGVIDIKARQVNNEMLVSIADNGQGISEEYQQIIFEKFVQIKDENGENAGSSGLGLAISKEIVKAHLGDIWVDSTVGEGSCFYFTLKLGGVIENEDINS